jgi:hypothetical protein
LRQHRPYTSRFKSAADNSYGVKFVPVADTPLALGIDAEVSVVQDIGDVRVKIQNQVLSLYGHDSFAVQQGILRPNSKRISICPEKEYCGIAA